MKHVSSTHKKYEYTSNRLPVSIDARAFPSPTKVADKLQEAFDHPLDESVLNEIRVIVASVHVRDRALLKLEMVNLINLASREVIEFVSERIHMLAYTTRTERRLSRRSSGHTTSRLCVTQYTGFAFLTANSIRDHVKARDALILKYIRDIACVLAHFRERGQTWERYKDVTNLAYRITEDAVCDLAE